jgi:hypothetical protein
MNDKDFAEMMEMKTNKAAKEIVKVLVNGNMPPLATMVSIVKASAIMLESFRASGEDAEKLEDFMKQTIKPARMEVREDLLPKTEMPGKVN